MSENREHDDAPRQGGNEGHETSSPYTTPRAEEPMPEFRAPDSGYDSGASARQAEVDEDVFGQMPVEDEDASPLPVPPAQASPQAFEAAPTRERTNLWSPPRETSDAAGDSAAADAGAAKDQSTPEAAQPPSFAPERSERADAAAWEASARSHEQNPAEVDGPTALDDQPRAAQPEQEPHPARPAAEADATWNVPEPAEAAQDSPLTHQPAPADEGDAEDVESTAVRRTSLWNTEDEATATHETATFATSAASGATAAGTGSVSEDPVVIDPHTEDSYDDILAGEELEPPRSRAWAHVGSIFGVLLLTPIAWYLLSDAAARFTLANNAPWDTGVVNLAAIGEFVGGLVVAFLIALILRASSVGGWITGVIVTVAGAFFIVAPSYAQNLLEDPLARFADLHTMAENTAHHLVWDGSTGRLAVVGLALIFGAMISHSARRRGRREERLQAAFERRGGAR
ncbi:MAG: hypothetical protein Q4P36_01605 [Bowdeniella nasicola]|nr:hypothetical protein [Bowdeniella nasicola]